VSRKLTEQEAIEWLEENASHIKLVKWGGRATAKSLFIDLSNNREFEYIFSNLKKDLERFPNIEFSLTKEERFLKRKNTCLEKYGETTPLKNKDIKEKIKQTCLKKYNVEYISQHEEVKKKKKETFLKNYGVKNPLQNKKIKQKLEQSILKKYGVKNISQNEKIKEKKKQTCLKNYGVENPLQNEKIKNKTKNTNLEKYGVENPGQSEFFKSKIKNTNIKKYGHICSMQNDIIKEKIKQKNIEKYGVEHLFFDKNFQKELRELKIKNGSIRLYEGKTAREWSKDPSLPSRTTILKAIREGFDPRKLKFRRSYLEIIVEFYLEKELNLIKNIDFVCNKLLPEHKDLKKGSGRKFPDFLLPDYNLIIECDGEYYHPKHLKHKDKIRNKTYIDLGYKLLVFSGNQIKNRFDYVERQILKKMKGK